MNIEHHVLAALAAPIASAMFTAGNHAPRDHLWVVALHEAAYAAFATALGIRIKKVSIRLGPGTLGHCRYRSDATNAAPQSDTSQALCMLWLSQGRNGWRETRLRQHAHDLVRTEILPIHRLAEALRTRHELAGDEAEHILAAARAALAQSSAGSFLAPISSR